MTHLRLFDGNRACGTHDGLCSDFLSEVTCQTCAEWSEANSLARLALGFSEFDYDEAGAFDEAKDDMNSRIYAEHQGSRSL
jgi:hypothetical protein